MSQDRGSAEERRRMIAEAAYFRAERRGFKDGDAVRDWCEAEAEIEAYIKESEGRQLRDAIEEGVASAGKALDVLRRKLARFSVDARVEWQKDVDRLATLRDALVPKLAELREHGEETGQRLREQADKLTAEIAALATRVSRKRNH